MALRRCAQSGGVRSRLQRKAIVTKDKRVQGKQAAECNREQQMDRARLRA